MPQRACIFCERPKPDVTITKEHLFSRWIDDVLTPDVLGPDTSYERTTAGPDGSASTKTWSTEVVAVIEAPVVCGGTPDGCNGGWMGGLDGRVKHLLRPMMLGQPRTLGPAEQLTIATWAAMKSMILEYVWGPDQAVIMPQAARTFIFRNQRPPEGMQIRIAAVESKGRPALATRRVYQLRERTPRNLAFPEFASCSTLVLGCFAVQTFGTSALLPAAATGQHGPDYLTINPPTADHVSWPPPNLLDDAALDMFAHPLQPITSDFPLT